MQPLLVLSVFAIILIAELPDKSMFASLLLGTRYSAWPVFLGTAAAFTIHVAIAVAAGGALTLLPHRVVEIIVMLLFLGGALYLLLGRERETAEAGARDASSVRGPRSRWQVAGASFAVIFLGEWGDITQITTANLAARYDDPYSVGVGALLGLWAASALAVVGGRTLLRRIDASLLRRIGGLILLGFAAYSAVRVAGG
jgi:putative Ca2+/H+ antiporter (TMEM165/GDT1 family)